MKHFYTSLLLIGLLCSPLNAESKSYEDRARAILKNITKEQISAITKKANSTNSSNEKNVKGFVLSSNIQNFSDISKDIDDEIKQIRKSTRLLIKSIALDIETNNGQSGTLSVDEKGKIFYNANKNLAKDLNEKRKTLLEANLKNSVSIKSASLAFNLLANINSDLKAKATKAKTRSEKEKLYMNQAIYVYEMSDIVLELLDSLTLEGKDAIDKLYSQAQERVRVNSKNIQSQKDRARSLANKGFINQNALQQELSDLDLIGNATKRSLDSWKKIIKKVGNQQDFLDKLKRQKDLIVYKKEKAKIQIETLRDLRGVAILKDSIGSLDDIIASVVNLDLLVLDEKTVSELLGYEDE